MHEFIRDEFFYPFKAVPLPYGYDALFPEISEYTMYFHHDKHYKGYVDKLNVLLKDRPLLQNVSLTKLTQSKESDIRNNAGGIFNHELYFNSLTPNDSKPSEALEIEIKKAFSTMDNFFAELKKAGLEQFGSGYVWLIECCAEDDHRNRILKIVKTNNQITPNIFNAKILLAVDVWEHSYYLDRQNRRDEYLDAMFKRINWQAVELRLKNNYSKQQL